MNSCLNYFNIGYLCDYSSIVFHLLLKNDLIAKSDYFSNLKLSDFFLFSFDDLKQKLQNINDIDNIINDIKSSKYLFNMKTRLYYLASLKFLLNKNVISNNKLKLYYTDNNFMEMIPENLLTNLFKELNINKSDIIYYNDIYKDTNSKYIYDSTNIYNKIDNKDNKVFIDISKNKNELITNKYYNSFDSVIKEKNLDQEYNTYMDNNFISKYDSNLLNNNKFEFKHFWNNYTKYENPIKLEGKVIHGFQRGSKLLGIPTGNIEVTENNLKAIKGLINGTYYAKFTFKTNKSNSSYINTNKVFKGALNIGKCPYFANNKETIEIFLIDYNEKKDFYDEEAEVEIQGYSRTESFYYNMKELVSTITYDIVLINSLEIK